MCLSQEKKWAPKEQIARELNTAKTEILRIGDEQEDRATSSQTVKDNNSIGCIEKHPNNVGF